MKVMKKKFKVEIIETLDAMFQVLERVALHTPGPNQDAEALRYKVVKLRQRLKEKK